jgi:hypothetical protein
MRINSFSFDATFCSGINLIYRVIFYPDVCVIIFRHELRPVVADDSRRFVRELFFRALKHDQFVLLGHRAANLPMHDVSTVPVEDRRQVVKRAVDVDVADVNVPVFMRFLRLMEACTFLGWFVGGSADAARSFQHAIDGTRTCRHHVAVEHHERKPPIAFQRIFERKLDDRLLLPVFEPPIARHPAVVLVAFAVAILPVVKLARCDAQPSDELPGGNLRALVPTPHVIDDFVAGVMGNPTSV